MSQGTLGPEERPDIEVMRLRSLERRKNRGAFFTPAWISEVLANWAIRTPADRVLEPACGEASLLSAAHQRLHLLHARGNATSPPQLVGYDLHRGTVERASLLLSPSVVDVEVNEGDFLAEEPSPDFDVVLANPPFLRYHAFTGSQRALGKRSAFALGISLGGRASSWAAFLVHSIRFVKVGGRIAFVLPAELLSVDYASSIREFLTASFTRVRVVSLPSGQFADAQVDVVLLLAEGFNQGQSDHIELTSWNETKGATLPGKADSRLETEAGMRWTRPLLDRDSGRTAARLHQGDRDAVRGLAAWGRIRIGTVTGNNRFFILRTSEIVSLGLSPADFVPVIPPRLRFGAQVLAVDRLTFDAWNAADEALWLFKPALPLRASALAYLLRGKESGVDRGYKCRQRSDWWNVPLAQNSDVFLSYMSAEAPRVRANPLQVAHTNSSHGIALMPQHRQLGMATLPLMMLSSQVLLDAEICGRKYGGGVLKLEVSEAMRLGVPSPAVAARVADLLSEIEKPVQERLVDGDLRGASSIVDVVVMGEGLGIGALGRRSLQDAYARLSGERRRGQPQ